MAKVFPAWVVREQGRPILLEADWPSTVGYKYGSTATGTDAAVTEDTDHFYGGSGAVKLLTGSAAIGNTAEIKVSHGHVDSRYVSFEMKWNIAALLQLSRFTLQLLILVLQMIKAIREE